MNGKEIKKVVKKRVAPMAIALGLAGSTAAFNMEQVFAVEPDQDYVKVEQENVETYTAKSDKYETKEEAQNWLDNKKDAVKDEYDVVDEGINELKNEVVETKEVSVNEEYQAKEEALDRKAELESGDVKDVNLSVNEKKVIEEVYTKIDVNETFKTEEEAKAFIESLKDKYNVSLSTDVIYGEWINSGKIHVSTLEGLTLEERDKEVERITNEIKKDEDDTTKYEITVKETSHTELVYVKDVVSGDTKEFASLEAAKKFIDELKLEENENVKIVVDGPNERFVYVDTETVNVDETFDTREAALEYLDKLKKDGYTIENESINEKISEKTVKVPNGEIIVKEAHKLDKNSKFDVKGNYMFIKQASGNVAIWTEEELSSEEKENIKNSFLAGGYDGSISKNFKFYYISGFGTFDLTYIAPQWGEYTIVKNGDDNYTMTCDSTKISHMDYGIFEKGYDEEKITIKEYDLSAKALKDLFKQVYDVKYQKTEKIYEEETTYGAEIDKEKVVRDKSFNVNGNYDELELKEKISYLLNGTYIQNIRGSLWDAYLTVREKVDEYEITDEPEKNPAKDIVKDEDDAVKTGDDVNLPLAGGLALTSLVAGAAVVRKRRRD